MGATVFWSQRATDDLSDLVRYIASDSPARAEAVGVRLVEFVERAAQFPLAGRMVPERREFAVREFIFPPYRIPYRVSADRSRIEILRVWHGARGRLEL